MESIFLRLYYFVSKSVYVRLVRITIAHRTFSGSHTCAQTHIFRHIAQHVSHTACLGRSRAVKSSADAIRGAHSIKMRRTGDWWSAAIGSFVLSMLGWVATHVNVYVLCKCGCRCRSIKLETPTLNWPFQCTKMNFLVFGRTNELTLWFIQIESRNDFSFEFLTLTAVILNFGVTFSPAKNHSRTNPDPIIIIMSML